MTAWMDAETVRVALAVAFGAGNATSMFLAVRGIPWAWLVVIVSQSLNITYLAVTDQWLVLVGGQPICLLIGVWGLQRWIRKGVHRDPRATRPAGPASPVGESLPERTVWQAAQAAYHRWMAQAGLPAKPWAEFTTERPREAQQWVEAARTALSVAHHTAPISDPALPQQRTPTPIRPLAVPAKGGAA